MKKTALTVIALLMVLMMGTVAFGSYIQYMDIPYLEPGYSLGLDIPAGEYKTMDFFVIVDIDEIVEEDGEEIPYDNEMEIPYELYLYCEETGETMDLGIYEYNMREYYDDFIEPDMDYQVIMTNNSDVTLVGTIYLGID